MQNLIRGLVTLNHQVERVHHNQGNQLFRKNLIIIIAIRTQIILDHNHLIIIETKIVHDDPSHVIAFEMYEITLIHV